MLNYIMKKCSLKTLIESDYITCPSGGRNFLESFLLYFYSIYFHKNLHEERDIRRIMMRSISWLVL